MLKALYEIFGLFFFTATEIKFMLLLEFAFVWSVGLQAFLVSIIVSVAENDNERVEMCL